MNRRRLALAVVFLFVMFTGVAGAYVYSSIAPYYDTAQPCGKLIGLPHLLQVSHFLPAEDHPCVFDGKKKGCDNSAHCEVMVMSNGRLVDSGQDGNCRLNAAKNGCVCVPQGKDQ